MALVICVVIIAVLATSTVLQRALPSESLLAFGAALIGTVMLFELDRLG
jgi:hypothetical protein